RMSANELKFRARLERALQPVPAVRAVSGKLTQLCLNLLLHAAHAIPEGHADEHCITLRSWAEGPFVFVEVSGTSRALTQEEAAQLFEPRFSAAEGNGLGLGLAIARNLVTEFGGDVRVESGGGAGARVVVRLPVEKPVGYGPPAMTETGKGRVLVVDDEPALRRTLARTLRDYEVETAASGREVQALLQSGKDYDVVLCDVSMPEMTGPELHRWMQQHHEALAKRLVFLSGGSFSPDINDALERSGARRLDKPFEAAKLKALVDEFVAARRG
ncbi:MAG TPA: response regulator, partial [Archangium sp.]